MSGRGGTQILLQKVQPNNGPYINGSHKVHNNFFQCK